MHDAKALAEIQSLTSKGYVRFSDPHAYDRMRERGATQSDVISALRTATRAELQDNGRFRVKGGVDLDGDDMTVIVELLADVLVVTLF